ncbi:LLM class F420-dependent oxidoreductase [Virgisporangium aliadipatigenens]|uniref:LLM class F420-dependent oxidoreductase n=1 Tax=Virgisporangium aliadipatigenens TaxID=741659 RepID=A0A8J4DSL5_9ACTN|nr:TIGR03621 family F420-dependent LLM class oxidoreductase [Virgisporangium aliadipatigenens]GIJ48296.1 LLM class F420-dependent oxidoreductase [Virgisporangium aliadipatigenens]
MRPFRFWGNADPTGGSDLATVVANARRAEAAGFAGLVWPDHLVGLHATLPLLTAVVATTERLRVMPFVLNSGLRHPAVAAQELATIDVLSGGRLDVAVGGGWNKPEYDAIGIPFPAPGVRVDILTETIDILEGCFAEGPFSYAGTHFRITDYDAGPRPAQRPRPPLCIGGGGKRMLTLAGRRADIVGLAPRTITGRDGRIASEPYSFTFAGTEEKIGWIRDAAGERFADLELNIYPSGGPLVITDDPEPEARKYVDRAREAAGVELSVQDVLDSPHVYVGPLPFLVDKLTKLRERLGISSFMLGGVEPATPLVRALAGK